MAEGELYGCVLADSQTGEPTSGSFLRYVAGPGECRVNETEIRWNVAGPPGPEGPAGADGSPGLPGADGTSCSVAQVDSSAVITCDDGTSAAIASAGTVVIYPEGQLGEAPPTTFPTGAVVVVDADGNILAEVYVIEESAYRIRLQEGPSGYRIAAITNSTDGTVVFGGDNGFYGALKLYYLEEDCIGTPFVQANSLIYWNDVTGEYFVLDESPQDGVLFYSARDSATIRSYGSIKSVGGCVNREFASNALPAIPYIPAPEILNAV